MTTDNKDFQKKVIVLKHKIFVFGLLLIGYFLYGYSMDINMERQSTKLTLEQKVEQDNDLQRQLDNLAQKKGGIQLLDKNISNLSKCYNNDLVKSVVELKCDGLPPVFTNKEQIVRNYLMMTGLNAQKMDFDQKLLLRNIVDYLSLDINSKQKLVYDIKSIVFGDIIPVQENLNLYKLRVDLQLDFINGSNFIDFVNNIEKNVSEDNKILFKIISVDFDIVNHLQPQRVSVSLYAYFYK